MLSPKSPKLSQREMLRRLLDSGKLTPADAETARTRYDEIVAGRIGGLNYQQGVWAEELCEKYGIVPKRPGLSDSKKRRDEAKRVVAEFEALPRPKKPPGKG